MQEIRRYLFAVLFTVVLSLTTTAFAMPPIMTADELQPGMTGVAETVVQGDQIESFNVTIIGVENNGKGSSKQILAQAYGPMMDDTNGVIHGMSGSPVYVNGYLIGAVARGIGKDTDPHVFYITPIEDMLELWQLPDNKADESKLKQVKIKDLSKKDRIKNDQAEAAELLGKKYNAKKLTAKNDKKSDAKENVKTEVNNNKIQFIDTTNWKNLYGSETAKNDPPEGVSLAVNGFHGAGMEFLKKKLLPFNMYPYDVSLGAGISSTDSLAGPADVSPGSSVGVALTFGDFAVGAVGTVTAVDGDKILAFGHPFTYRGNVNYFLTDASIVGTASGIVNGQKVSSFGKIIGRINQDRYSGVSGILNKYPSVVPVKVTVTDKQSGRKEVYATNIAYDEEMLPSLATSVAYASLDRTIDSLSAGTADVKVKISTNVIDNARGITRSNMFYNSSDVGQFAVSELGQMLNIICADNNKQYDITGIDVNLEFNKDRQTASIINVIPDKTTAHIGDTVNLKVVLQPYRNSQEQILIPYIVPKDQTAGNMTLEVRGGGLIPVMLSALAGIDLSPEEDKTLTAQDKIKDFLQTDKNNEIVIEPTAPVITSEKEQKKAVENALKLQKELEASGQMGKKSADSREIKTATDYIIDNVVRINLDIKK